MDDAASGGPLKSVTQAVNLLKSLKSDPGRVLVASIVGDSLAEDPDTIATEREQFTTAKCGDCANPDYDHPQNVKTYICKSSAGKAEYGSRYLDFTKAFGSNGISANICSDAGILPALNQVAKKTIQVLQKVCLPRPVADDQTLVVTLIEPTGTCQDGAACCADVPGLCADSSCGDGSTCAFAEQKLPLGQEAGTASYRLEPSADCSAGTKALMVNQVLPIGTSITIDYQAQGPSPVGN
ncbi:MAG: hypothetical protein ACI9OJ_002514 [Myxococcota bacterium]